MNNKFICEWCLICNKNHCRDNWKELEDKLKSCETKIEDDIEIALRDLLGDK